MRLARCVTSFFGIAGRFRKRVVERVVERVVKRLVPGLFAALVILVVLVVLVVSVVLVALVVLVVLLVLPVLVVSLVGSIVDGCELVVIGIEELVWYEEVLFDDIVSVRVSLLE